MKVYITQPIDKMSPIETSHAYAINGLKELGHDERGHDADAAYFIDEWENLRRCQAEHALCEISEIIAKAETEVKDTLKSKLTLTRKPITK